jgi:hypothetical protein
MSTRTIKINGVLVDEEISPFLDTSGLMSRMDKNEDIVLEVPCKEEFMPFLLHYFRYGCLPRPIRCFDMYSSLNQTFDFLMCNSALLSLTLEDMKLNEFTSIDFDINNQKGICVDLFDEGDWIERKKTNSSYPLVFESKKHILSRTPDTLLVAENRMFSCRGCYRKKFVSDIFHLFTGKICIAGGCIQHIFKNVYTSPPCMMSDIDFFLIDILEDGLEAIIKMFAYIYQRYFGDYMVIRSRYAVTFFRTEKEHKNTIQVILRNYKSFSDVIDSFDLDSSCLLYDGTNIYTNRRGLRCIHTSCNLIDVNRQSTSFEKRILKYVSKYDIGVAVPNFDPSRIDFTRGSYGLALLLENRNKGGSIHVQSYNTFGNISQSTSLSKLITNIGINMRYTSDSIPFILRRNNPLVFKYFGDEEKKLCSTLKNPLIIGDSGSFAPVSGPWYAQAYGGCFIDKFRDDIKQAINTYGGKKIYERNTWRIELGPNDFIESVV